MFIIILVFTPNDLICLKTTEIIADYYNQDNSINKEIVIDIANYQNNDHFNTENENYIRENFSKTFKFSDLNQLELFENYKNSENEIEW